MINKIIAVATFLLGIISIAFLNGKRAEKNKQNEKAIKTIKDVKTRDKARSTDNIDIVKQRLRKNSRNG